MAFCSSVSIDVCLSVRHYLFPSSSSAFHVSLFCFISLSHRCPRKCNLVVSLGFLTCVYLCPLPIVTVTDDNKSEQEGGEAQTGDNGGDEDKLDESPGKPAKPATTPASSEFKKTWGFRRTTIAKREMPGEAAATPVEGPVRRSGRQAKRTDKLEEFLLTAKRGRGGGGRRSAPANLDGGVSGDPPSQTPTDAETASEASFDGSAEAKTPGSKAASPERKRRRAVRKGGRRRQTRSTKAKQEEEAEEEGASEDEASSEDEPADAAQDAQKEAEKEDKKPEVGSIAAEVVAPSPDVQADVEKTEVKKEEEKTKEEEEESKTKSEDTSTTRRRSRNPARACKDSTPSKTKAKARKEDEDESSSASSSSSSSSSSDEGGSNDEGYDPNALYCICRQKHNKR